MAIVITHQVYPTAACDQAEAARLIDRLLRSADFIIPGHDRQVRVVEGRPCLEDVRSRPALPLHIYGSSGSRVGSRSPWRWCASSRRGFAR